MTLRPKGLAGGAVWAVLDYGLFSLAGMVASVLLARHLAADEYGAFSISLAVSAGVFVVHSALFSEPLLVLLSNRFRHRPRSYLTRLLAAHALFSAAIIALVAPAVVFELGGDAQAELRAALFWMALAGPFTNLTQLLRRVCYALLSARAAAIGSGGYLVLTIGALLALEWVDALEIATIYAAFAACGLAVSSVWLTRAFAARDTEPERVSFSVVARAHFAFARFGIGTGLIGWVPMHAWYVVVPWLLPDDDALGSSGHLRALVNLMLPMVQLIGAPTAVLATAFARELARSRSPSPWRITWLLTAIAAGYAPLLGLLGPYASDLLYKGAYPADPLTFWILGAVPAAYAFYTSLRVYCVARELPELPLWATLAGALSCATVGVALCAWKPLLGSAIAMLQAYLVQGLVVAYLLGRQPSAA